MSEFAGRPAAWLTCSQIAGQWESVTLARVDSVAAHIGIRPGAHIRAGADGLAEYSPAAVGLIERELQSRGLERAEDIPVGEEIDEHDAFLTGPGHLTPCGAELKRRAVAQGVRVVDVDGFADILRAGATPADQVRAQASIDMGAISMTTKAELLAWMEDPFRAAANPSPVIEIEQHIKAQSLRISALEQQLEARGIHPAPTPSGRQLALIAAHLDRQARGGHGGPALNSLELAGLAAFLRSLGAWID